MNLGQEVTGLLGQDIAAGGLCGGYTGFQRRPFSLDPVEFGIEIAGSELTTDAQTATKLLEEQVLAAMAPVLQHYVDGDLDPST